MQCQVPRNELMCLGAVHSWFSQNKSANNVLITDYFMFSKKCILSGSLLYNEDTNLNCICNRAWVEWEVNIWYWFFMDSNTIGFINDSYFRAMSCVELSKDEGRVLGSDVQNDTLLSPLEILFVQRIISKVHSGKVPMGKKPLALSDSVTQITT